MCTYYATRHLAQRITERLNQPLETAQNIAQYLADELNAGRFEVLRHHKDTGFIAYVDGITCDVRPELNGARGISTVFYKVNQWNNRRYAKAYWPLIHKGMEKDKAHAYIMSVILPS